MDLLLIVPHYIMVGENMWRKINPRVPPLNLGYIASFLLQRGIRVNILDIAAEGIDSIRLTSILKDLRPDYIGITATTVLINGAIEIAHICKEILPDTKVVIGGVHSTIFPDEVLSHSSIDYVVRGEGEWTLLELIERRPLESITGLSYKSNGEIVHNPPRTFIEDLDSLPHPAYHLLPMHNYKPSIGNYKRLPAISIITSRGCPGRCTFCYTGVSGKRTRFRSAENIIDEIKLLIKDYKIRDVSFYDDTFTAHRENVLQLCNLLRKEKLNISWSCMSRIDMIDPTLLKEMGAAGCHQIGYGIECADEDVLRNINKPMSLNRVGEIFKETRRANIDVRGMFMFGNPGETESTMKKTLHFAIDLDCDIAVFNITTPYPGTEMFGWAKENGYLLTFDWEKYDLSKCIMRLPTVEPQKVEEFYRKAYRQFYLRPTYLIKRFFKMRSFLDLQMNLRFFLSMAKDMNLY